MSLRTFPRDLVAFACERRERDLALLAPGVSSLGHCRSGAAIEAIRPGTRMRLTSGPGEALAIPDHSRRSPLWSCVAVVIALLLTFQLDRVTDSAPVQHLYYVPIVFAAIRLGWR